ncbi:hypothetical protein LCGC14_0163430 [marine sediment metagenome]|uniref:Uncharacterized protein n=1 Tax=marine sediment metagenome TaxID=412755 RepID=A0A0F9UY95_9ZZZZ
MDDDHRKKLVDRVYGAQDEILESTVRGNEVFSPEMAEKVDALVKDCNVEGHGMVEISLSGILGCGKTTLARIIGGHLEDAGARVGYMDPTDAIDPKRTRFDSEGFRGDYYSRVLISTKLEPTKPSNIEKPILRIYYADLEPVRADSFSRECPFCVVGTLLLRRDDDGRIEMLDRCIGCGQQVKYVDADQIGT